ncbi:MAG: hypothetical protein OEZ04_08910 [Nitrospinota bacterium]|nr:hypothetical protein [Nitrospinota bacterium]
MEVLEETAFVQSLGRHGIEALEDGQLAYIDKERVLGFDFTNLSTGRMDAGAIEMAQPGDRRMETTMVRALFKIIEKLELFPVHLFSAEDEWLDEDPIRMKEAGHMTEAEANALILVDKMGGKMAVLQMEQDELDQAVSIVTPQMTLFSNRCAATDESGKFLACFSEDDEVSFNTTDKNIYQAARKMALEMRSQVPFEIIFAEDYK